MWHPPEVAKHFSQQLSKKLHGVFRWIFGHPKAIPPLFPSCQVTSPAAAFAGARTLTCDTWHTDLLWCACDLMECIDHMIHMDIWHMDVKMPFLYCFCILKEQNPSEIGIGQKPLSPISLPSDPYGSTCPYTLDSIMVMICHDALPSSACSLRGT